MDQIQRVHGHWGARKPLDRRAMLFVHIPQRVAHDLEGNRVDVGLRLLVQLELRRDAQVLRRHIAGAPAVEHDAGELA